MEIRFVSITAFRTALEALLKVKRKVYAGVPEEICKAFQNVGIEQIRANRDMILMDNDSITVKLRLPDKRQRLSWMLLRRSRRRIRLWCMTLQTT